ncbi:hypothetical protein HEAR1701 [Herminiimonas arsenicoxydans]|uniref:Uncharacterized protein n=1 Tax=Herminiimonas arsenicoxydans TaxID=204773 RepID=A4G5S1_HERAR|nr:hypothetical protein HEAR1701 [Herminiimonas arsenicoxydans]
MLSKLMIKTRADHKNVTPLHYIATDITNDRKRFGQTRRVNNSDPVTRIPFCKNEIKDRPDGTFTCVRIKNMMHP